MERRTTLTCGVVAAANYQRHVPEAPNDPSTDAGSREPPGAVEGRCQEAAPADLFAERAQQAQGVLSRASTPTGSKVLKVARSLQRCGNSRERAV